MQSSVAGRRLASAHLRTQRAVWRLTLAAGLTAIFGVSVILPARAAGADPRSVATDQPAPVDDGLDAIVRLLCELTRLPLLCPPDPPPAGGPQPPPTTGPAQISPGPAAPEPQPGRPPTGVRSAVLPSPSTTSTGTALPPPRSDVAPASAPATSAPPGSPGREESAAAAPRSTPAGVSEPKLQLATPDEVDFSPRTLAVAAGISILGMILLGFPAELFNNTLQANYGRLRRIFPWIAPNTVDRTLAVQVFALLCSCAVAGIIGSFQKVHDWSLESVAVTAVAIGFGFFLTVAVFELAGAAAGARMGLPRRSFRAYHGALPIVVLFVGVSALGRLEPAYVYGHLAGSGWHGDDPPPARGRALQAVAASVALLVVAVACWAGRAFVSDPIVTELLAGVTLVALNRLAFGLLPLTFLSGHSIASYSRALWVAIYTPVVMVFLVLVLLPAARGAPERVLLVSLVLFVLFAGLSVGLWATFRRADRGATTAMGAVQ